MVDAIRRRLNPSALDYLSISSGTDFDRTVWATANQYPLTPGVNRLILIRDAEKLNHRGQLDAWMLRTRQLPGVHLVFVSNDSDLPYSTVGGKKTLKPQLACLKAPRGSMVRCSMPAEKDAVAWARRRADLDDDTAKHLLTRSGGDLSTVAAVCAKLSLFTGRASKPTIDLLCVERPVDDFTETLLALDKRRSLLCIPDLDDTERYRLTGLLDSRLDLLAQLHRHQLAGHTLRELTGVNPYLARQYLPLARLYDPQRCAHRRRVLAVVDDAIRSGARIGVLEALVALW